LNEYDLSVAEIEKAQKEGKPVNELSEQHKVIKAQEEYPF